MNGDEQSLTLRIAADVGDTESSVSNLGNELERLETVTAQVGDAAQKAGAQQQEAAAQSAAATREVSAAQQAVIDSMRQRMAMAEAVSNVETASAIKRLEHETQMGRQSLEMHLENLQKLTAATEASSAARIAAERAVQSVNAQLVAQTIAEMRAEVVEGKLSAEQQMAALRSIATEAEYALNVRKLASEEASTIEARNAKIAADAVIAAEREAAAQAKAAAAEVAAAHKEEKLAAQESAYVMMDIGYAMKAVGLQGSQVLGDLTYLFRDLTSVAADTIVQMALIAGAVSAVVAVSDFLLHSTEAFEKNEQSMRELSVIVKDQGASWDQLKGKILEFAEVQEQTTNYSRTQVVDALRSIMRAGIDAADAMKVVRIAEDAATATGKPLVDITHALMEATQGRTRALVELGVGTKESIKDGMAFNDVLSAIEKQMGGEAQGAADTYAGKMAHLHNTLEKLQVTIGSDLLPAMDHMADATLHLVNAMSQDLPAAERAWGKLEGAMKSAIGFIEDHKVALEIGGATAAILAMRAALDVLAESTLPAFGLAAGKAFLAARVAMTEFFVAAGPVGWIIMGLGAAAVALSESWSHDWGHIKEVTEDSINAIIHAFSDLLANLGVAEGKMATWAQNIPGIGDQLAQNLRIMAAGILETSADLKSAHVNLTGVDGSYGGWDDAPRKKSNPNPADTNTGIHTMVGGGSGGKGGGYVPSEVQNPASDFDSTFSTLASKTDQVKQQIEALKAQEVELQHELKMTTTEAAYNAKAHENQKIMIAAYGAEVVKVRQIVMDEALAEMEQRKTVEQNAAAAKSASYALQAYENSLEGTKTRTHAQAVELKALENAVRDAGKEYKASQTILSGMHTTLDQHSADLASVTASWLKLKDAAEETIPDLTRKWNEFLDKQRTDAVEASIAVHGTWQQQAAYYKQMMDSINVVDDQSLQEKEAFYEKLRSVVQSGLDKQKQDYDKFISEMQSKEETWLNTILTKHESFRASLKTIWQGIVNDFEKNIETMIMKSSFLTGINGGVASAFGQTAPSSMSAMGIFSSILGNSSAAASGNLPDGTQTKPVYVALANAQAGVGSEFGVGASGKASGKDTQSVIAAAAQTNGILGANLGSAGADNVVASLPTSGGLLGLLMGESSTTSNVLSAGGITNQASVSYDSPATAGSVLKDAGIGLGAGMSLASALNPQDNQTTGAIGGAAGAALGYGIGTLGGATGGPLGAAIGSAAGSLIGSFFGPHETAQQTPDTSQAGYQEFLADWQGTTQVSNGTNEYADAQYDTSIGNQSEAAQIASYINTPANYAGAPAGVMVAIQALQALEGPSKSLALNPKNPESQGIFHLANGQNVSVTDMQAWVQTVQEWISQSGGATSNVFTVSRTYPSAGDPATAANAGNSGSTYTPVAVNVPTTTPGSSGTLRSTLSSTTGVPSAATGGSAGQSVNVIVQGSVIGATGVNELALILSQALQKLGTGSAPGTFGLSRSLANQGNF